MKLDYMMASPSLTFSGWFWNFQKFQKPSDWLLERLFQNHKKVLDLFICWMDTLIKMEIRF